MIAVTSRHGEPYSLDPRRIERIETTPDTVVHMIDGRTYVLAMELEDLLRTIRDSHAELLVVQKQLAGGTAELAASASTVRAEATLRLERRARARDGDSPGSAADRRPLDGPPEA